MMIMEDALFDLIKSITGLGIGAGTQQDPFRLYDTVAPTGTPAPFVIMQRTASERWRDINNPSGIVQATIQIDAYAETKKAARTLALTIEKALDGYVGTQIISGTSPQVTCKFSGISCQNDLDQFDKTDRPFLFRRSADYLITYAQT